MEEPVSQVEETVVEDSTELATTTTDTEVSGEATPAMDLGSTDLSKVNLDSIRDMLKSHPDIADAVSGYAKSLQGDYTRKTQDLAVNQKALTEYVAQFNKEKQAQTDENLPDFNQMDDKGIIEYMDSRADDRAKRLIQESLGPLQQQMNVREYESEISALEKGDPNLSRALEQEVRDIAINGLTTETAFKAAAYDHVKSQLDKLTGEKKQSTATAINQTGLGESGVTMKSTVEPKRNFEEIKAIMQQRIEAGEFD